jgi:hypothetical protein
MLPKPIKRLPVWRKAVTIIAGFKTFEGIVICSDTQETSEHSKRNTPKLIFEPYEHKDGSTDDLAAAFCGSGESAFVEKLIANAWEAAQAATSLDEACDEIEKNIKTTYKEFGEIYQIGSCPTADLIYGVKMFDGARMFFARGPVVNERHHFDSSGIGYYMADFLADRMYETHLTLNQCVILSAYILFQAKEHVEGCGGDSHIAVLRKNGVSGLVGWKQVEAITDILKYSDKDTGSILLQMADLSMTRSKANIGVCAMGSKQNQEINIPGGCVDTESENCKSLTPLEKAWHQIELSLLKPLFHRLIAEREAEPMSQTPVSGPLSTRPFWWGEAPLCSTEQSSEKMRELDMPYKPESEKE